MIPRRFPSLSILKIRPAPLFGNVKH